MNKNRLNYTKIKHEITINPRDSENLNIDHPLAQDINVINLPKL
jgi:hypothetical protein